MIQVKQITGLSRAVSLLLLAASAVVLVGLQNKLVGWLLWGAGLIVTLFVANPTFRRHLWPIYISLAMLGTIPITTEITNHNFFRMGGVLLLALLVPFGATRLAYGDRTIKFPWHHGRRWLKTEIFYILITAILAYFLLPWYLQSSGAYLNWAVENTTESITRLFIGTNGLGIWDELFFVSTVLALLRQHLPFFQANLLQAVLFTSFLYELGFTGWGPVFIYPFALTQGYIFRKTESLLYVITIHLTLDLVLFLALLNAHHPNLADIFIV